MNETEKLAEWLRSFQGLNTTEEIAELAIATKRIIPVIEDKIERLHLETEPASFERLLHELAPEELKNE